MMRAIKYYAIAIADAAFLTSVHDWTWFDESAKRVSIVIGVLIGIITIVKGIQDFKKNRLIIRKERLEVQREEEKTRRFFEEKYRDTEVEL